MSELKRIGSISEAELARLVAKHGTEILTRRWVPAHMVGDIHQAVENTKRARK